MRRPMMRRGQAMTEYAVVLAAMLVVVAAVCALAYVARAYAVRTENLVTSDCP
ncbi:MAG: hypothetical protein ACI4RD_00870 [Kiritimatiellia bacterium]